MAYVDADGPCTYAQVLAKARICHEKHWNRFTAVSIEELKTRGKQRKSNFPRTEVKRLSASLSVILKAGPQRLKTCFTFCLTEENAGEEELSFSVLLPNCPTHVVPRMKQDVS